MQRLPFAHGEFCRMCSRVFVLLPHGPRCFCCRAIGNIVSIDCTTLFFFTVFFSEVLQHTQYKGSAHAAVAEVTQRVLSGSSDWEGGRAMRRLKAASRDQAGVKGHLRQLTAKVKRALLRLPRQCRLNQHLLKTPQPPAVSPRALISLIAILNCSANDKSLVRWRCAVFVCFKDSI